MLSKLRQPVAALLLTIVLVCGSSVHIGTAVQTDDLVHPLLTEPIYDWYKRNTDAPLDPEYAGAYVMATIGDRLFLGLSASVPTHDNNGPLLAEYVDGELKLIAPLNEQDVNRMRVVGDKLFIPGYDPNQGWDAGNLYIFDTTTDEFTQLRYRYDAPHFVDATTTNAQGHYRFTGLKASSYIVKFIPPEGYAFTKPRQGHWGTDSNPNQNSGTARSCSNGEPFRAIGPFEDLTLDAGMRRESNNANASAIAPNATAEPDSAFHTGEMTIGDLVWVDSNGDGVQDADEPGLEGVRVELYTRDPYFPCVIHASGFWGDPTTGELVYNGGVLVGGGPGNIIFSSPDYGETWDIVSQETRRYWAWDLVYFKESFYKTYRRTGQKIDVEGEKIIFRPEATFDAILQRSDDLINWEIVPLPEMDETYFVDDKGVDWTVRPMTMDPTNALVVYKGKLVLLNPFGENIYSIIEDVDYDVIEVVGADLTGILSDFHEPDFPRELPNHITGASNRFNTIVSGSDEVLYSIGGNNVLYATTDLESWYPVTDFSQIGQGAPLISLFFWEKREWLLAATVGRYGNLYYIEQGQVLKVD